jgi:ammonia channel protein AmtB
MIPLRLLPHALAAAVVAGGLWWFGAAQYARGSAACEARHAAATVELNNRLANAQAAHRAAVTALVSAQGEAQTLIERLNDEAENDPAANSCGLSAGSLQRLNAIR